MKKSFQNQHHSSVIHQQGKHSLSFPFLLFITLFVVQSMSKYQSPLPPFDYFLSLSQCLSASLCLSVSLSLPLPLSISAFLSLSLRLILFLSLYQYFSPNSSRTLPHSLVLSPSCCSLFSPFISFCCHYMSSILSNTHSFSLFFLNLFCPLFR